MDRWSCSAHACSLHEHQFVCVHNHMPTGILVGDQVLIQRHSCNALLGMQDKQTHLYWHHQFLRSSLTGTSMFYTHSFDIGVVKEWNWYISLTGLHSYMVWKYGLTVFIARREGEALTEALPPSHGCCHNLSFKMKKVGFPQKGLVKYTKYTLLKIKHL